MYTILFYGLVNEIVTLYFTKNFIYLLTNKLDIAFINYSYKADFTKLLNKKFH